MRAEDDKVSKSERAWEPMRLTRLGKVGNVVQGGEGKISLIAADPGEPRKTRPSG